MKWLILGNPAAPEAYLQPPNSYTNTTYYSFVLLTSPNLQEKQINFLPAKNLNNVMICQFEDDTDSISTSRSEGVTLTLASHFYSTGCQGDTRNHILLES